MQAVINIYLRFDMPRALLVGVKEAIREHFRNSPLLVNRTYFIGVDHTNYIELQQPFIPSEQAIGWHLLEFITNTIARVNHERINTRG